MHFINLIKYIKCLDKMGKMIISLENHLKLAIAIVNGTGAEVGRPWRDIIAAQIPRVNRAAELIWTWIGDGQISMAFNQELDQGSHWGETADSGVAMRMPKAPLLRWAGC